MKAKYMFGAVAASALLAGAAYAQDTAATGAQTGMGPAGGTPATTSYPAVPGAEQGGYTTSQSGGNTSTGPATTATSSGAAGMSGSMNSSMSSDMSASASTSTTASSATSYGTGASVTTTLTTNGPVPDTAENRAKYGQPMSHAGKRTAARGN